MHYQVTMTSPAHRMFRKLPPNVRKQLVSQAQKLAKNPQLGEQLEGVLRPFRSLHTTFKGTHYRIVYEVNTRLKEIVVRGVGPRENLYKKLRRMKLKPLSS
jgi:mRNA-degrading endonuclease RelE of RelBE toxin-antitoxin system